MMEVIYPQYCEWLRNEVEDWNNKQEGVRISHLIPAKFEAYCKIFHPFEEVSELDPILVTRDQANEILEKYKEINTVSVSWQEVAVKYNLEYYNELTIKSFQNKFDQIGYPQNLFFPSTGFLPRKEFEKVIEELKDFTLSDEVGIYQLVPNTIWKDNKFEDYYECQLEGVFEYFKDDFVGYLFERNKEWLIFTDIDLTFTLVGGSKELIEILYKNPSLDVLKCELTTRIDDESDKKNI